MIRLIAALTAFAMCGAAQAQPAPRTTLDIALSAADGFVLRPQASGAPLAIGRDGSSYVLLHQAMPALAPTDPARAARVDLVAVSRDGAEKWRQTLPVQAKRDSAGFAISSLGVIATTSGNLAVVWSAHDEDPPEPPRKARADVATLLRLDAEGRVRKVSPIGPPSVAHGRSDPRAYYELYAYLPTPDNAVLLGGGFGSGPYGWWLGKFNLDGIRLWQAGPGQGFPERVASIGRRPDGGWMALVTEMPRRDTLQWALRRYAADGRLMRRTRLPVPVESEAAVLPDGGALLAHADDDPAKTELVVVDDIGRVRRRVAWPYAQTLRLIAAGDGLAAIVQDSGDSDAPAHVVRVDTAGVVRWRSTAADIADIVATPDGDIAALLRTGSDGRAMRLVRYSDP